MESYRTLLDLYNAEGDNFQKCVVTEMRRVVWIRKTVRVVAACQFSVKEEIRDTADCWQSDAPNFLG